MTNSKWLTRSHVACRCWRQSLLLTPSPLLRVPCLSTFSSVLKSQFPTIRTLGQPQVDLQAPGPPQADRQLARSRVQDQSYGRWFPLSWGSLISCSSRSPWDQTFTISALFEVEVSQYMVEPLLSLIDDFDHLFVSRLRL